MGLGANASHTHWFSCCDRLARLQRSAGRRNDPSARGSERDPPAGGAGGVGWGGVGYSGLVLTGAAGELGAHKLRAARVGGTHRRQGSPH